MYPFEIRDIAVYHGATVQDNAPYIDHFKAQGKDVTHFLCDVIGRDKRYLVDSEKENSLTMAMEAVRRLLKKTGVAGSELDMIVFSSQLPEYVAPPSSVHIHHEVGGKTDCICYDVNVNCAGMSLALDQAGKYLAVTPSIKKAVIVGCDYVNLVVDPDNDNCYGHYGDAACAMLLEKTTRDSGLVDSVYWTHSVEHENILFPRHGFSKLVKSRDPRDFQTHWAPFDGSAFIDTAVADIRRVLGRNKLTVDDIGMFCFSQYAYCNIEKLRSALHISESKSIYVGGEYGYTGTSSPFIALYTALERKAIRRDEYVLVWTIGAGQQAVVLLLKY